MNNQQNKSRANVVLTMGVLFNLTIGVLYAWSTIKKVLMKPVSEGGLGFSASDAGNPYTLAIVFFSLGLLVGGRIQDKIGPKKVITLGGFLVGLGILLSGIVANTMGATGLMITFGLITGSGIGLGYGCVSPPALKWFHPSKKGIISGLVVGGFGLAAVYYAPLAQYLLGAYGISKTFIFLGIFIMIFSFIFAQFIDNPPAGYVPEEPISTNTKNAKAKTITSDIVWKDMIKTQQFWIMCIMYMLSSSVGLMIIGNLTKIVDIQIPAFKQAALLVSYLAITNTLGRVVGGILSDKIGRISTLKLVFVLQAINMFLFASYTNLPLMIIGLLLVGFCYGTLLSVFPTLTADNFGLKNYGLNYGIVYLFWGLSGVLAPKLADYLYGINNNFNTTYMISGVTLIFVTILSFFYKEMKK